MVSRALGLGNRKSCKNSTGEFARTRSGEGGREKARPVCSLSISSSSTSEPQAAASREAAISRGAAEVLDARQGKMEDSLSQSSSRERRVMRRKSSQILHFEVPQTASRACENPKHLMHLLCGSSRAMKRAHGG